MIEFDAQRRALPARPQGVRLGSVVSKTMELATQVGLAARAARRGDRRDGLRGGARRRRDALCAALRRQSARCGSSFSRWASARRTTAAPRRACSSRTCATSAGRRSSPRHVTPMTEHSLTTRERARARPAPIRERGYAVSREDVTLHACAVGAPVHDETGEVVAAVSLSGIEQRFSDQSAAPSSSPRSSPPATELSRRLGYAPPACGRRPCA